MAVFGLLITVHEAGHMLVAKWNGVRVLEFNIGFGQPLVRWGKGETRYGIRLIPLGGYVRLAGMDDGDDTERSFNNKPVWRRITIIAAGATTNLLLPLLIFFVAFVWTAGGATIQGVIVAKPADAAGIMPGDQVASVNGHTPQDPQDFRSALVAGQPTAAAGTSPNPVSVAVKHPNGQTATIQVTPTLDQTDPKRPRWVIGVTVTGSFSVPAGARATVDSYKAMYVAIFGGLADLFTGRVPGGALGQCGLSGPVGIVRETAAAAAAGLVPLAEIAAFISVNLGILNLLPLPALDGGRLLFLVIEAIRRKPINPEREQRVHYIGLVVLVTLILLISYNDIGRVGTPLAELASRCQ